MKYKKIISKLLILGLCLNNNIYSSANDININQTKSNEVGTWKTDLPIIPTSRHSFGIEVVDGKIYCIGGIAEYETSGGDSNDFYSNKLEKKDLRGVSRTFLNEVEVYNLETNEWNTSVASMPTVRREFGTAVVGKKIYCIGGLTESGAELNKVEVYDTEKNTWDTTKSPMPIANSNFATAVIDDKIYCIGGNGGSPMYTDAVYEYNTTTDVWVEKEGIGEMFGIISSTAEVVNGKIYLIGGTSDITATPYVFEYDPINDSWSTKRDMPTYRAGHSSVVIDEKIYCIGGKASLYSTLDVVEVYDPSTDTWDTSIMPMPTARYNFGAEVVDGKIYCIGGYNGTNTFGSMEAYVAKIISAGPVEPQSSTSNIDVYINPQSVLSLSLDTNNITFEDFTGVEDMEKKNAINLTVESSLPYEISSSLESEIYNSDRVETVDKRLLSIKANSESSYSTFPSVNVPVVILNSQATQNAKTHGIDLRLNKNIISKADVYKATIRFEVKQK